MCKSCWQVLWCNQCKELLPEWVSGICWIQATKVSDNQRVIQNTRPEITITNWGWVNVQVIDTQPSGWCPAREYRLSVSCCDERVRVCPWQWDPKFLTDAIDTTYPIEKDVNCSDWVITISLDQAWIIHPVYKDCDDNDITNGSTVMTPSAMNSIYQLGDCYWWFDWPSADSDEIPLNELTPCKQRYLKRKCSDPCSCCAKGIAEVVLVTDTIIEQKVVHPTSPSGTGSWFYVIADTIASWTLLWQPVVWTGSTFVSVHQYWPLATWDKWYITNGCNLWRLVTVEAWGSVETSRWVNGIRMQIYMLDPNAWTFEPVAERRDSPISDPDVNWDWIPDNYKVTSDPTNTGTKLNRWYRYQERQNFYMKRDVWMTAESSFVLVAKVSTVIDDPAYDPTVVPNWQVSILGRISQTWWVSWDLWAYLNVKTIDDCCIIKTKSDWCNCGIVPPPLASWEPQAPKPSIKPLCWSEVGILCLPAVLPWTWSNW